MTTRRATHSGSWYTSDTNELQSQLSAWLAAAGTSPVQGCKAIIAPHAGYSYSGPAAAWAYRCIDTTGIKRVIVLGPSHHYYLPGCALSTMDTYATPVGSLPIDKSTVAELRATGKFEDMSKPTDEDEHSLEMHLPYIRKAFEGLNISIVPILVGALDTEGEQSYGALLAPYMSQPDTFTVVSSDFCHWGLRFQYTLHYPNPPPGPLAKLSRGSKPPPHPIHKSIEALDREAISILERNQHTAFAEYLRRTRNTICGRHPIGVLLAALETLGGEGQELKFVRYEQSSQCVDVNDSSVSYASAYVVF
ncbi:UPF0103-domain-containing protein [Exidia glandulosa HHB12029]|uniref:UPF0103-domain-containing protein n=1 Tax=Exidia glandulosa HHB12029 TaxID=1314781 RepID=A0A166BLY7_EXIGL|nr:UPF0103-domain-containing protein [Exidia glandulosa HHB12029]